VRLFLIKFQSEHENVLFIVYIGNLPLWRLAQPINNEPAPTDKKSKKSKKVRLGIVVNSL
jgi:hypothetical protein